jgi:prepilin signal peptidase PulO-like enzyme (type II secretory pathway)
MSCAELVFHRTEMKKSLLRIMIILMLNIVLAAGMVYTEKSMPDIFFMTFLVNGLYLLTVDDIRTHEVKTVHLYIIMLAGAVSAVCSGIWSMAGRLAVFGILFLILHLIARRQTSGIGSGDVKIISSLSLYMNLTQIFNVLFISLAVGLIYGLVLLALKKATVKSEMPFLPFLMFGTLIGIFA